MKSKKLTHNHKSVKAVKLTKSSKESKPARATL